jgi:hypothetical protein
MKDEPRESVLGCFKAFLCYSPEGTDREATELSLSASEKGSPPILLVR